MTIQIERIDRIANSGLELLAILNHAGHVQIYLI